MRVVRALPRRHFIGASPASLLPSMTSRRIRRTTESAMSEAKRLMTSHYFIALGSLPKRLPQHRPQQKAARVKKKNAYLGPIYPRPRHRSWEVPVS